MEGLVSQEGGCHGAYDLCSCGSYKGVGGESIVLCVVVVLLILFLLTCLMPKKDGYSDLTRNVILPDHDNKTAFRMHKLDEVGRVDRAYTKGDNRSLENFTSEGPLLPYGSSKYSDLQLQESLARGN